MSSTIIMIWIITGAIGSAYFIYGKKQQKAIPLICAFGLMAVPYFISSVSGLLVVCLLLIVLPFIIKDV